MSQKTPKAAEPARPAPVSLHPLSLEQALGALLRTPHSSTTKRKAAPKAKRARPRAATAKTRKV